MMARTPAKCPVMHGGKQPNTPNRDWWPNQLSLSVSPSALRPLQPDGRGRFNYAEEFKKLDLEALRKRPPRALMTELGRSGGRPTSAITGRCFIRMGLAQRGHLPHR